MFTLVWMQGFSVMPTDLWVCLQYMYTHVYTYTCTNTCIGRFIHIDQVQFALLALQPVAMTDATGVLYYESCY